MPRGVQCAVIVQILRVVLRRWCCLVAACAQGRLLDAGRLLCAPIASRHAHLLVTPVASPLCLLGSVPFGVLEAFLASQEAPVLEHVGRVGVQRPVVPLARLVRTPRHFDEAVVKR